MTRDRNLFVRAVDALVAGREREAKAYLAHFERHYGKLNGKLTKR